MGFTILLRRDLAASSGTCEDLIWEFEHLRLQLTKLLQSLAYKWRQGMIPGFK